jgi:hypothetical protein
MTRSSETDTPEARRGPTAARLLRVVPLAAVILGCFTLGTVAGIAYAHDPAPPTTAVRLTEPPATEETVRGTIASVTSGGLVVESVDGPRDVILVPNAPLEVLRPLEGAPAPGTPTNAGGTRGESGFVLTGVVTLERVP